MLTVTATNFGVNPNSIMIREYHQSDLLVLDGTIQVFTTYPAYAGIQPMKLTVADLPFSRSRVGTALVTVRVDNIDYATITKVWISDKNTINIAKIDAYKASTYYSVHLNTILIPSLSTGPVVMDNRQTYVPEILTGGATGVEAFTVETPHWLMMVFKASTLSFDPEFGTIQLRLPDFPAGLSWYGPLFYNESMNSPLGSKCHLITLSNGVIIMNIPFGGGESANTKEKFTRFVLVK